MTIQGRIYFCACHMLYTAVQLYYELQEDSSFHMDKVNDRYAKWTSEYHEIMGWCIEELVFPYNHEKIPREIEIKRGDIAEVRDEELAIGIYDAMIKKANLWYSDNPTFERQYLVYSLFCMYCVEILRRFDTIMHNAPMVATVYAEHYADERPIFEKLLGLLDEEQITAEKLMPITFADVQKAAEELGNVWRSSVFSAANELADLDLI